MLGVHRGFVADQRQRDGFGIALRMMADGQRGLPLLYHCTSGKERTGWMTAIVLTALGVPHAAVVADYLLANDIYQARYFKLGNDLAKTGMMRDPGLLRPIMELNPGYLEAAFDEVGQRYGSLNEFNVPRAGHGRTGRGPAPGRAADLTPCLPTCCLPTCGGRG